MCERAVWTQILWNINNFLVITFPGWQDSNRLNFLSNLPPFFISFSLFLILFVCSFVHSLFNFFFPYLYLYFPEPFLPHVLRLCTTCTTIPVSSRTKLAIPINKSSSFITQTSKPNLHSHPRWLSFVLKAVFRSLLPALPCGPIGSGSSCWSAVDSICLEVFDEVSHVHVTIANTLVPSIWPPFARLQSRGVRTRFLEAGMGLGYNTVRKLKGTSGTWERKWLD